MRPRPFWIVLPVLMAVVVALPSKAQQRSLLLSKLGNPNKIVFDAGEHIRFRLKGDADWHKGLIVGFDTAHIKFKYYQVHLNEIEVIDIRDKPNIGPNFGQYGSMLSVAGVGYFLMDWARNGNVTRGTAVTSGILVGSGLLLRAIRRKYFKVKGRFKIIVHEY